jgi:small subunit ribosomal protein MRP21
MEIRRVGDAILRSQISPLTFLTPSTPSRCPSIAQRTLNSPHRKQLHRLFASSARCAAKSASVTTSASPPVQDAIGDTSEKTSKPLDWLAGSSSSRASRLSSHQAQPDNRATSSNATQSELLMNKGNSADDLLRGLNAARAASRSSNNLDVDRMAFPQTPKLEVADLMKDISKNINNAPPPARTPMRLTPSTGRTVYITPQIDVGKGFRLMEQLVARNKVKSTFNYQRFHERPGLKRKRLHSLRWRKRFMAGFKAAVNRVKQLKKQGW